MSRLHHCLNAANRTKFSFVLISLCLVSLLAGCQRGIKALTVQEIENFLKSVDAASVKRDPQVLLEHLAPDASISVQITAPNGPQPVVHYTGKEYSQKVTQELKLLKSYKYERKSTKIEIAKNGQAARAAIDLVETISVQQVNFQVNTHQLSTFALQDGKLWIKKVEAQSTIVPLR